MRSDRPTFNIIDAMARTLYVTDWADREDEKGHHYPGQDLFDVAPRTSQAAYRAARKLARTIEELNQASIVDLCDFAADAPGKHYKKPTPEDFGYGITMQSLGHGVSWFDDHPEFPLKLPHVEYHQGRLW
jgi:hypothetical protein